MLDLLVCMIIPLVTIGALTVTCQAVKDNCYHCSDPDASTCYSVDDEYNCYYSDKDYDFVCEETKSKLFYVVASFATGIAMQFTFSILSCVKCCRCCGEKNGHTTSI